MAKNSSAQNPRKRGSGKEAKDNAGERGKKQSRRNGIISAISPAQIDIHASASSAPFHAFHALSRDTLESSSAAFVLPTPPCWICSVCSSPARASPNYAHPARPLEPQPIRGRLPAIPTLFLVPKPSLVVLTGPIDADNANGSPSIDSRAQSLHGLAVLQFPRVQTPTSSWTVVECARQLERTEILSLEYVTAGVSRKSSTPPPPTTMQMDN
ncbi:hypothetical protein FB45DRAFT_471591 [Roridomyces roridus]|uniref:Uncharacterized protein n=1 Tax=Roridomyces roridus TaxID=1738132 RepID=A0AAD7FR58_9AGAR|nr:hypothetical protein FB45DRAFT_471591 [Roridomyces roridus]